jgi:hypothetical protein
VSNSKPPTTGEKRRFAANFRQLFSELNEWFPTVVRYLGVVLIVYAALIDKGKNPALIPAGTGMLLFKTVVGGKE